VSAVANGVTVEDLSWKAQDGPQREAVKKPWVEELLFGGAAGGGKTDFLLGDFAQDVPTPAGPYWHGILFRRTYPQLEEVVRRSLEVYPQWFDPKNEKKVVWKSGDRTWVWKNGATLKLRFLENDNDWMEYQGHQYGWMAYDELTTWPNPENYLRMKARLRSANPNVKYRRIRATANPGGPGHHWVRTYFGIDRYPKGFRVLEPEDGGGMRRMFIPSRVQDNKILLASDPNYIGRLKSLGSPELVRAWLEGDWSVIQGAYFPEFDTTRHVIAPFDIPGTWMRLRTMDWGSAAPFAVYWIAISDGQPLPDGRWYPKGAMVVYREWYGAKGPNVGVKMTAEEVAEGIVERERDDKEMDDAIIDPACFAMQGGPSIAERMARATDSKCWFRRGDNKRIPGWDAVRQRLKGTDDGPMLYIFQTCPELIRTLPAVQHDQLHPEDVDTDGEDHGPDALRYGCMSRPWTREDLRPTTPTAIGYKLDDLWLDHAQRRRRN
jgi:hypothetical protein